MKKKKANRLYSKIKSEDISQEGVVSKIQQKFKNSNPFREYSVKKNYRRSYISCC